MTTITINNKQSTPILGDTSWAQSGWNKFVAEIRAFASVIFTPRRVLANVERMAALHREAARVEATNPARAAELRQDAARIGL